MIRGRLFYGWVVVIALFIIQATLYGVSSSFGLFFKSIESEFNLTRTATSAITSTSLMFGGMFAFWGGWALDKYSPRLVLSLMGLFTGLSLVLTSQTNSLWQLFITYSLLVAMGTGAMYVAPTSTITRWFDKKRGTALGIAGAGFGSGILVMVPIATYLIVTFNWRIAYMVIGIVAWLVVIPLSQLLRKDPQEIGALPDGANPSSKDTDAKADDNQSADLSLLQTFRTRSFWFISFSWLLLASNLLLVLTHLVPHATDIGFSPAESATLLSLIGGTSIASRVLVGFISDRIGRKLTAIICFLLMAGAMIFLVWARDLWMFYLFAMVFGFAYGGMLPGISALIGDTFGLRNIGAIFGVLEIAWGVGAALGPLVGGRIFDVTNSYSIAFLIGAAAVLAATLLFTLISRETNRVF
ncbi:MAG: MFS transporter [Dehalococcoidales bacterium]|nr:MFS transporter [Dehalococcoidales bacterium]